MDFNTKPSARRRCVNDDNAWSGNGIELSDGRVLYTYLTAVDDKILLKRGYAASIDVMTRGNDTVTDIETIAESSTVDLRREVFQSISYTAGRLLMIVMSRAPYTVAGTTYHPGFVEGFTCFESVDDGVNWTATNSAFNLGYGSGAVAFGAIQAPGAVLYVGSTFMVMGWEIGNYFGAGVGGPAIYYSSDLATWARDSSISLQNIYNEPGWSRNIVEVGSALYAAAPGQGLNGDPRVYRSTTGIGGFVDLGVTTTLAQPYPSSIAYSSDADWWIYFANATLTVTDAEYANVDTTYTKITSPFPTDMGTVLLYETAGAGTVAWGNRWVDLILPGVNSRTLAPLRIPWPRWPADAYLDISSSAKEQEHQNHLAIDRWWARTRKGLIHRMYIPYKRWAIDAGLEGGALEEENYLAIERWAAQWNKATVAVRSISIPHRKWASPQQVPPGWIDKEQENYLAIERSINASR